MAASQGRPDTFPDLDVEVRRARSDEAAHLTALALRSKASWGYDAAFLEACVGPLTVTPAQVEASPIFVLEVSGQVAGFYGLGVDGDEADLAYLFIEPTAIGRGFGAHLWRHAVDTARSLGLRRIRVEADPYAEHFYRAMGAERIGEAPSGAVPGRMLPLLIYPLTEAEPTPSS